MKAVNLPEPTEREYCDCPARHTKGRCDSDFPANTYSLPLTDRQAARIRFVEWFVEFEAGRTLALSVTEKMLYADKTHKRCDQCRVVYKAERSTSQFCSDACRKRHSRDLT